MGSDLLGLGSAARWARLETGQKYAKEEVLRKDTGLAQRVPSPRRPYRLRLGGSLRRGGFGLSVPLDQFVPIPFPVFFGSPFAK